MSLFQALCLPFLQRRVGSQTFSFSPVSSLLRFRTDRQRHVALESPTGRPPGLCDRRDFPFLLSFSSLREVSNLQSFPTLRFWSNFPFVQQVARMHHAPSPFDGSFLLRRPPVLAFFVQFKPFLPPPLDAAFPPVNLFPLFRKTLSRQECTL